MLTLAACGEVFEPTKQCFGGDCKKCFVNKKTTQYKEKQSSSGKTLASMLISPWLPRDVPTSSHLFLSCRWLVDVNLINANSRYHTMLTLYYNLHILRQNQSENPFIATANWLCSL